MHLHAGSKPFKCPYCTSKFNLKGNLSRHMKVKHGMDVSPEGQGEACCTFNVTGFFFRCIYVLFYLFSLAFFTFCFSGKVLLTYVLMYVYKLQCCRTVFEALKTCFFIHHFCVMGSYMNTQLFAKVGTVLHISH